MNEHANVPPVLAPPTLPDPQPPTPPARPWGFWATIGFTIVIVIIYFVAQVCVAIVYASALSSVKGESHSDVAIALKTNTDFVMITTVLTAPVAVASCVFFAWIRKNISVREYLALNRPSRKSVFRWSAIVCLLTIITDAFLTFVLNEPLVHEWMIRMYQGMSFIPLMWIATILAAPIGEEFLFRGFMFAGLRNVARGWLGPAVAILVTSSVWALVHVQYEIAGVLVIFGLGIVLGLARAITGSLPLCIMLHALSNFIATVQLTFMPK